MSTEEHPPDAEPRDAQDGPGTAEELLPKVYDELRRLARVRMSKEPAGLTLQPTALVHEAYLRIAGDDGGRRWDRRGHFFAAAAIAMRRILVERARHYQRTRHGAGQARVDVDAAAPAAPPTPWTEILAVNDALSRLEKIDARKAQVVMLRYFAGLTIEETGAALDLSPTTVKQEWTLARVWLYRTLGSAVPPEDDGR